MREHFGTPEPTAEKDLEPIAPPPPQSKFYKVLGRRNGVEALLLEQRVERPNFNVWVGVATVALLNHLTSYLSTINRL